MANKGKELQIGAGSRSRSQARAEDTARRSRRRAADDLAMKSEVSLDDEDRLARLAESPSDYELLPVWD